jgi:hypothetical protein
MMQAIMWLVLGATVVGAALVDQFKMNRLTVPLGPAVTVGDVTLSLPRGWESGDAADDPRVLIVANDPSTDDQLLVSRQRIGNIGKVVDHLSIGDYQASLRLHVATENGESEIDLIASRPMPSGLPLVITLITDANQASALQSEIDLIKRIAATVKIRQSGETSPT